MNFVRHNYGFIAGAAAGLVLMPFLPFTILLGTAAGVVYDRKPEWLGLKAKKPNVDQWVNKQIDTHSK